MPAPESTVLQANFKTPVDSMVNVYGSTGEQFTAALNWVKDNAPLIMEVETALRAVSAVGQVFPGTTAVEQPPAQPAWGTTPPPPQAPPQQGGWGAPAAPPQAGTFTVPVGPDGRPRVAKSGHGQKGPWKAWMTAARKGEPGYAEPIWIKQGTPEWDAFPA